MGVQVPLGLPQILDPNMPSFADESTYLWSRCWVAVGVENMVAKPGQVLPATIGSHGVHVLRHEDGKLDAGYNVFQQGSCWNIPVQCGNGFKIECAYVSCGHSRDGGVLDPADEPSRRLIRQVIGARPTRRLLLPFELIGPVMFVALPGNRSDQLRKQLMISDGTLEWIEAAEDYSGYMRKEAIGNWRFIGDNLRKVAQQELGPDTQSSTHPPNLIATKGEGWLTLTVIKPISLNRSEIAVAKYGNAMQKSWTNIWDQIIDEAGNQNCTSGPTAKWAESYFS